MTDFKITDVERSTILEMVKQEQIVRYSKGIQEAYTTQFYNSKNENYERVNIEREIQKYILRKFLQIYQIAQSLISLKAIYLSEV